MTRNRSRGLVGAKLKKARERRGISLRQVSDSTKISVFVLQALERDDVSNLPGGVVGRGFVRSFASAVNLDPEAIVAEFVAQFPDGSLKDGYPAAEGNELPETPPSETPFKVRHWEMSVGRHFAAVGVLVAVLVAYVVFETGWPQWAGVQNKVVTATSKMPDNAVQAQRLDHAQGPAQAPNQSPAPDPPPLVKAKPASADPPPVPPGRKSIPVAVSPAATAVAPGSSTSGTSSASAKTDETPETDTATPIDEPLRVVLSATSPSWVIASVDGKTTINRLLDVGQLEILIASKEMVLTAGNGGAIVMTVNGAAARTLGRTGETVKVNVNRANFRDFLDDNPP